MEQRVGLRGRQDPGGGDQPRGHRVGGLIRKRRTRRKRPLGVAGVSVSRRPSGRNHREPAVLRRGTNAPPRPHGRGKGGPDFPGGSLGRVRSTPATGSGGYGRGTPGGGEGGAREGPTPAPAEVLGDGWVGQGRRRREARDPVEGGWREAPRRSVAPGAGPRPPCGAGPVGGPRLGGRPGRSRASPPSSAAPRRTPGSQTLLGGGGGGDAPPPPPPRPPPCSTSPLLLFLKTLKRQRRPSASAPLENRAATGRSSVLNPWGLAEGNGGPCERGRDGGCAAGSPRG